MTADLDDLDPALAYTVGTLLATGDDAMPTFVELHRAQSREAHRVLGELMERIPHSTRMWRWSIRVDATPNIEATLGVGIFGHDARAKLMAIAEQFSLDYSETPSLNGKNMVAAAGTYSGVPVKIFELVQPCSCENCELTQ